MSDVGRIFIFYGVGYLSWIHKKCSGIKGPLRPDPDFRCACCLGKAPPIDGRLVKEVKVNDQNVEAVPELCYLGDMISAGGGCHLPVTHVANRLWACYDSCSPPAHQPKPATFDQRSPSVFNSFYI